MYRCFAVQDGATLPGLMDGVALCVMLCGARGVTPPGMNGVSLCACTAVR